MVRLRVGILAALLLGLALLGCVSASAVRSAPLPAPPGLILTIAQVSAARADHADLFTVEARGAAYELVAYDMLSGSRKWGYELAPSVAPPFELTALDARVVVTEKTRAHSFDRATGEPKGTFTIEAIDEQDTASFESFEGACAVRSRCSLQLFDCTTALPVGAPFRGKRVTLQLESPYAGEPKPPPTPGCWGFRQRLVGRAKDALLVAASEPVGEALDFRSSFRGVDVRTGKVLFDTDLGDGLFWQPFPGLDPTRTIVAFASERGWAAYNAHDGKPRGDILSNPDRSVQRSFFTSWVAGQRPMLFAQGGGSATMIDIDSGRTELSVPLAVGDLALIEGIVLPPFSVSFENGARLITMDAHGAIRKTLRLPDVWELTSSGDGIVRATSSGRAWTKDLEKAPPELAPETRFVVRREGAKTVVHDTKLRVVVSSFDEHATLLGAHHGAKTTVGAVLVGEGPDASNVSVRVFAVANALP